MPNWFTPLASNLPPMKTLLTLLALAALTFAVYALADGPSLIQIIDNPRL